MGFAKPIEQIFIKLSRYIYVSKRYYTRKKSNEKFNSITQKVKPENQNQHHNARKEAVDVKMRQM